MGWLWEAFGEMWGWMAEEKPIAGDVFPPQDTMARNGGADQEGAILNYWGSGFEVYEEEYVDDAFNDLMENEEDDDGEYDEEY